MNLQQIRAKRFWQNVQKARKRRNNPVTTKYGKENESEVFNLIWKRRFLLYSIIQTDGFNIQERAKAKAENTVRGLMPLKKKSNQYYEASNEGQDF